MEDRKTSCTSDSPLDLSQLPRHSEAVVAEISAPARLAARLRELGFLPGEHLRVLRSGTALIVQIGQTRIALRRRDAAAIRLVPSFSSSVGPVCELSHLLVTPTRARPRFSMP